MKLPPTATFNKSRVETFSDGVFAIIVTLLVLELKVPHIEDARSVAELFGALAALLPKFLSWVLSFFTVCVIWVNHHRLFKMFKGIDHGIFWTNALLLLFSSSIPFPTALMGDYLNNKLAVSFYGTVLGLMAVSFVIMRRHVIKNGGLLAGEVDMKTFRAGTWYALLFGPVPYFTAAALAWVSPVASLLIYLGIPVYFITSHSTQDI